MLLIMLQAQTKFIYSNSYLVNLFTLLTCEFYNNNDNNDNNDNNNNNNNDDNVLRFSKHEHQQTCYYRK